MANKLEGRELRKLRIRKKLSGTPSRPRLSVFRSARHIYVQAIDDEKGVTVAQASTLAEGAEGADAAKCGAAKAVGAKLAKALLELGIGQAVFDRNGYLYHGRIKALADGAREAGLRF